ncbi:MAG: hypothetical protein RL693_935 [Verrucomicrobiota bacterium]|jgi:predicted negative regulator of RcsB-dependent stress response
MSNANTKPVIEAQLVDVPQNKMEQFLEQNFKKILIAFALVAVLLGVLGIARHFQAQTELEAAEKFTSATTAEECEVVIQKYPGSVAAGNAILMKADLLWQADKKQDSVTELNRFLKDLPQNSLRPHAMLALASKQAALGETANANKTLDDLLAAFPKSEIAAGAQALKGDLLWADGKVEEAKKIFEGLPRNYPGSAFLGETEERLKMMNSGLPTVEVDAPPAPPAPVTPPAPPALTPLLPELKLPATPPVTAPAPAPAATATPAAPVPAPAAPTAPTPAVPAPPAAATTPVAPAPTPTPAPAPAK